jgi:hypothetical protein
VGKDLTGEVLAILLAYIIGFALCCAACQWTPPCIAGCEVILTKIRELLEGGDQTKTVRDYACCLWRCHENLCPICEEQMQCWELCYASFGGGGFDRLCG